VLRGTTTSRMSSRFHNGLANMVAAVAARLSEEVGARRVVLSGGVWQNITLLRRTLSLLQDADLAVYLHTQVPTNDGGIALGQAVVAAARLRG
jgi:hydrogenase maturation protein HypF